ncbi:hypothetical protein C1C98_03955 [Pseudomonas ogarae]|uniref:Uncharacterized protein n=1 Tax=Pseudomonas ogarae (strain DSM 112162 / CECT 30235 / F113) TaxID=1114970 RepID=A0ABM6QUQ4_PSEO1|nr:hypothetical protein C1C98_03955 [Pseudomonas ogarae]
MLQFLLVGEVLMTNSESGTVVFSAVAVQTLRTSAIRSPTFRQHKKNFRLALLLPEDPTAIFP